MKTKSGSTGAGTIVSDTLLNTYTNIGANGQWGWWLAFSKATGANTVTLTQASNNYVSEIIGEYSGVSILKGSTTLISSTTCGPLTPSSPSDTLVFFGTQVNAGVTYTLTSAGTLRINTPVLLGDVVTSSAYTMVVTSPGAAATVMAMLDLGLAAISGNAGTAGATISFTGVSSGSVTADGSGNYSIPGLANGAYTLTPSKVGFTFSPTTSNQTVAGANISGVNFTATSTAAIVSAGAPMIGAILPILKARIRIAIAQRNKK
jgi:hypothetical protein